MRQTHREKTFENNAARREIRITLMADRKEIETMTFELLPVYDFYRHFGDGYCVEMPLDKKRFDDLLNYLSTQKAMWKFYAMLTNGNWFRGIHITFQEKKYIEVETIMHDACKMLGIGSYCVYADGTQTIIDAEGNVIAFTDLSR